MQKEQSKSKSINQEAIGKGYWQVNTTEIMKEERSWQLGSKKVT